MHGHKNHDKKLSLKFDLTFGIRFRNIGNDRNPMKWRWQ